MKDHKHIVKFVQPGSIGEEMGIAAGDCLLAVNDTPVEDIFDYHYLMNEEYVEILIGKPDGEEWLLEVEKEYDEDLGVEFENGLMDEYRSCSNKCIFCFIDQMPPGMRKTLYFKDDDSRLSFLQGNYVTLTNMSDHDLDRIIRYHLSPINISFHTTNKELRCEMLHNRFAGEALDKVDRLYEAGIEMNGQIVLCKGINDGEELDKSIRDLAGYLPYLQSVSVVPVGLSKYREGLYPLEPFEQEDAKAVLAQIRRWQEKIFAEHGIHFIHASDEWYLMAEEPLPEEELYDGYPQLENGVGMLTLLEAEVKEALEEKRACKDQRQLSIATGVLAAPFIRRYADLICDKYPEISAKVYPVANHFFGEKITVSGLLTGRDLMEQLRGKDLGEQLLLSCSMLRSGENIFLDDVTVEELEQALDVKIRIVDACGSDLVEAFLCPETVHRNRRRQMYEQTDCSHCGPAECGEIHTV
ncbi:MAG: DUF512 domain-containing protein [Blautia sp.]